MTPTRFSRVCAVLALACVGALNPLFAQRAYRQPPIAVTRSGPKHLLYRVTGSHGATVYLLGSVHLLTAEAGRLPPEVDTAFAHAKTIAFETSLDTVMLRAPELLARGRYANGATLRSSLSPAAVAALDTVLPAYGLTVDQMNGFKPWFVSMVLSQLVMQRSNFQAQYGVEIQLNARAHEAGKTIIGLEPVDVQLGLFDSISPADQERMLLDGGMPDSASRELLRIKDAWLAGDAERIDSIMNRRTASSANLVATLVTKRTLSWMPAVLGLLAGKDDALVVVGAGHIVGSQGLVALLRAKGYTVEQL
jgi:uncharacterized protein YbaP (TraB family)